MMSHWVRVVALAMIAAGPVFAAELVIDGRSGESFWRDAAERRLEPVEEGVPGEKGGQVLAAWGGGYLCLAARLPEEGGRVLARSVGRNPVWERDHPFSPPVEDRIEFQLRYADGGGVEHTWKLAVNPWGAYRLERDGKLGEGIRLPAAAAIDRGGWSVEAAVPVELFGGARAVRLRAVRIRARRPLEPEFRWRWPAGGSFASLEAPATGGALRVEFRPPPLGNTDPPLEVGRVQRVPPMPDYLDPTAPDWNDPAWRDVPAFRLPRNEPYPRPPRYPTEVKWMHDGETLALLVRVTEPEQLAARHGGRDGAIGSDDHFAIRLATTGPYFVEILVNSVGAIRDWRGSGIHSVRRPPLDWNGKIETQTNIRHGAWIARIDISLADCARALGEEKIPREWRVLLSRFRAARPGEPAEVSALPPVGTDTFYGLLRYRRMRLSNRPPAEVGRPEPAWVLPPASGLARELARLDSRVWPPLERHRRRVRTMVERKLRGQVAQAILAERRAWDEVRTRAEWEEYRAERLARLRRTVGRFPPARPPLDYRVTATHTGDGYRLLNVVYQTRPGFYATANLYLPARPSPPMPAIIIHHSFHYSNVQLELHDMGALWARAGCIVLIPERLGFGERLETAPWYRYAYLSRFVFKQQLAAIGETYMGWLAWDLIRAVDLLYARPDVDRDRILMIGAVAGGAEPAAIAAALDDRIDMLVPFNYDHGRIRLDADFPGELANQLTMSFITASIAPRHYVRASEFGWEGAEQPGFPTLWVDGWKRSQKVWGFYGARSNLASVQGYGLIRLSMERVSHCFSVGPQQRRELYPILERWFGIPPPSPEDLAILPNSLLSVNPYRAEARRQEAKRRRPYRELLAITPAVSAQLPRKPLHRIAYEAGREQLRAARARRRNLREELRETLGEIDPRLPVRSETFWKRELPGAWVEALSLDVEEGVSVPMLLIHPPGEEPAPAVVAVTKAGKGRFLANGAEQIASLVQVGVAVCLPDVRGTGETAPDPDWSNDGAGLHELALTLGRTVLGARLRDLRSVLAYLRTRPDIAAGRIALWGDAFAPANPRDLRVDELRWESAPQIQYHSEPLGASLALLAALYEDDVVAVAAQRGLAGYLSLLEAPFVYAPMDSVVPGILEVGDLADVAAALAPRPLLLAGMVNGRNVRLETSELEHTFRPVTAAFAAAGAAGRLTLAAEPRDAAAWLRRQLRQGRR